MFKNQNNIHIVFELVELVPSLGTPQKPSRATLSGQKPNPCQKLFQSQESKPDPEKLMNI